MCSAHGCGGPRPHSPPLFSPELSVLHFQSPPTEAAQWPVHIPFFRLFFRQFLLFYFLFPPPFVVPALCDPYFTHSSIGGGVFALCASVYHLDPWSVKTLIHFCPPCVSRLFCPATVFLFRLHSSGVFQHIQIELLVQTVWSFSSAPWNPPQACQCQCEVLGQGFCVPTLAMEFISRKLVISMSMSIQFLYISDRVYVGISTNGAIIHNEIKPNVNCDQIRVLHKYHQDILNHWRKSSETLWGQSVQELRQSW